MNFNKILKLESIQIYHGSDMCVNYHDQDRI
jgi:hypothetical protein